MARITERQLAEYLEAGYELRAVEYKPSRPASDNWTIATVARAVLGMANRRDGGKVIIGVDDENNRLRPTGVEAKHLPGWNQNDVSAKLAEYADPFVTFELQVIALDDVKYVVVNVDEFEEIPVLARKDFQGIIRRGALYVRSRSKPETSEVPTQAEMREVLELATFKAVRRLLRDARAAGLVPPGEPDDIERFNAELRRGFE